ncbi:MAG: aminopeptidase P family protein [Acidobacteria bacterium]|nr:aminopeptidase P family protein [Acidobacteriota bacterium]
MQSRRRFLKSGFLAGAVALVGCKQREPSEKKAGPATAEPAKPADSTHPHESPFSEPLMQEEFARRLASAQKLLIQAKISGLFLTPSTNFYYLSGMRLHRSERLTALLIPARGEPVIVAPAFEAERVGRQGWLFNLKTWAEGEDSFQQMREALLSLKIASRAIGIEPTTDFETLLNLRRVVPGASLVSAAAILDRMRMIKSPRELEFMRKAVEGVTRAMDRVLPTLTSGLTERQAARDISTEIRRLGGDGGGLVQFGSNTAVPHGEPTDRKLAPGDVVIFDIGMRIEGYTSDITRTCLYKERNAEVEKIFDIVLRAQRAGQAAASPGVTCEAVDDAARRVIQEAGYEQYFTHRLGHGLGLDGHEKPYLVHGNKTSLQPGMTITMEPGIYIPGKFGVRIEDDFVIMEDGCKPLSTLETNLRLV